jgi:hypothetical protein
VPEEENTYSNIEMVRITSQSIISIKESSMYVPLLLMLYKLSFSASQDEKISYTIGKDNFTEVNNSSSSNEIIYKIKGPDEFIPGQTNLGNTTLVDFNNVIKTAGFYDLSLEDQSIKGLAFNYDRIESNLDYESTKELKDRFGFASNIIDDVASASLGDIIKEKDSGVRFWRWCLILALIFLAIETLLLRFWKL